MYHTPLFYHRKQEPHTGTPTPIPPHLCLYNQLDFLQFSEVQVNKGKQEALKCGGKK